jgi:cell division septation protein DedD
MSKEKATADRVLGAALHWWQAHASSLEPTPVAGSDSAERAPVTIAWKAPLYRVRMGPFASRAQAEEVLGAARSAFPEAFIVPDRIQNRQ